MERGSSEEREMKEAKRKKKTPLQIEMLEKAYAENTHPSEAVRAELSAKLGLTNRQMQMWFCNRRLKDKKGKNDELETNSIQSRNEKLSISKETPTFYEYPAAVLASEVEDDALFGQMACRQVLQESEQHSFERLRKRKETDLSLQNSPAKSPRVELEIDPQAIAISIMAGWGETFREDGPVLGFDFDPLPPGAFDLPTEQVRYSSSVSSIERSKRLPVGGHNGRAAIRVNGSSKFCSNIISPVENVPRDQQVVLAARERGIPPKSGALSKAVQVKPLGLNHMQLQQMERTGFDYHVGLDNPVKNLFDIQYVQGALSRPSRLVPTSRETLCTPKRFLPPSIKSFIKHDEYGFEGGELTFFPAKNIRENSELTLMS